MFKPQMVIDLDKIYKDEDENPEILQQKIEEVFDKSPMN